MTTTKDVDTIHKELLSDIDDGYQKTQGFPTWDITRAFAFGIKKVWDFAYEIFAKQDVDNLTGDELTKFVFQRKGVERKAANAATGVVTVEGTGTITAGDLFESNGGVQFKATETKNITNSGKITIQAVTAGATGNVAAGVITKMPVTLAGIAAVTNDAATSDGYDIESDTDLRNRYYEALREPITSANVYHYKQWAKSISGVGDAKVIGCWNGANTVKVIIIDSDRLPAGSELITRVQAYIDPDSKGIGEGEAPIGACCTVVSASNLAINITLNVSLNDGYTIDQAKTAITKAITQYLAVIAFVENYVSYAKVGATIIDLECISDYDTLTLNGNQSRVAIPNESVATTGTVTVNVNT